MDESPTEDVTRRGDADTNEEGGDGDPSHLIIEKQGINFKCPIYLLISGYLTRFSSNLLIS